MSLLKQAEERKEEKEDRLMYLNQVIPLPAPRFLLAGEQLCPQRHAHHLLEGPWGVAVGSEVGHLGQREEQGEEEQRKEIDKKGEKEILCSKLLPPRAFLLLSLWPAFPPQDS